MLAKGLGLHAKVTAVNAARNAGLTPTAIGTSRPICPACVSFLDDSRATIVGLSAARWVQ